MDTREHGAAPTVRHGLLLASQRPMKAPEPGVSAGHGRMPLSDDGLCRMGEVHPLGRDGKADQQFGRTRERERAGSTGRAGCSRAGEPLVCRFFIGALLVCGRLTHARDEQQTTDDSIVILTGWSCRVNAPMRNGSAGATLAHMSWVIGTCETAGECCHTDDSWSAGTEKILVGQRPGPRENDFASSPESPKLDKNRD
jgi:hypothetical protein